MDRLLHLPTLLVLATFLPASIGQIESGDSGNAVPIWGLSAEIHGGQSPLCNKTFADANVTGLFSINPDVYQGPQAGQTGQYTGRTLDSGLALTISNPGFGNTSNVSAAYSLWYSPNGANYSNDYALGYDVCALAGFSFNYNTQLRGQSDDGSCLSTLDQPCISAIEATVEQYAAWLTTPSPGPNSNLTNTSLPGICHTLSHMLVENLPNECSYFFQDRLDGLAWPLTSFGNSFQTGLYPSCTINGTYQNALSFFNNASESIYTAWAHAVTPLIFVWMPVADVKAQTVITNTVAKVFCGHANHFNDGSFEPPAAPAPTPVAYNVTAASNNGTRPHSHGLSGGAIAGIVIGVLILLALAAGLALWLWRRRRKSHSPSTTAQQHPLSEKPDDSRYELHTDGGKAQLAATEHEGAREPHRAMLDSTQLQEMEGEGEGGLTLAEKKKLEEEEEERKAPEPVELPADSTQA